MNGKFKIQDHITIQRVDKKTNKILSKIELHNLVVNTGKARVAKLLAGLSSSYFNYIAIGVGASGGTGSPTVNDIELENEVARALAIITEPESKKVKFSKTFTFGSAESYEITEAGIFDGSGSGITMLDRFTFEAQEVDWETDLKVEITITVA
ncbi:MAG: hypothetical protein JW924_03265 [Fusobacteriaceae bacterium]|nr:hypothetical protein [Fusobacteriaceae bacterium]